MRELGPVTVQLNGDRERASRFVGVGRVCLARLYALIGKAKAGARSFTFGDVTIRAFVAPGIQKLTINAPAGGARVCLPVDPDLLYGLGFNLATATYGLVLKPDGAGNYQFYARTKDELNAGVEGKIYKLRILDTCGNAGIWYDDIVAGNTNWVKKGTTPESHLILSWRGKASRYIDGATSFLNVPSGKYSSTRNMVISPNVFYRGNTVKYRNRKTDLGAADQFSFTGMNHCSGAAIQVDNNGKEWFIYCCGIAIPYTGLGSGNIIYRMVEEKIFRLPVRFRDGFQLIVGHPVDAPELLLSQTWNDPGPSYMLNMNSWLFNPSGTAAVATRSLTFTPSVGPDYALYKLSTPISGSASLVDDGPASIDNGDGTITTKFRDYVNGSLVDGSFIGPDGTAGAADIYKLVYGGVTIGEHNPPGGFVIGSQFGGYAPYALDMRYGLGGLEILYQTNNGASEGGGGLYDSGFDDYYVASKLFQNGTVLKSVTHKYRTHHYGPNDVPEF